MLQLTLWSLPAIAATALALDALRRTQRAGRGVPGVQPMKALCAGVAVWALGQVLGSLSTDLDVKILTAKLQYPGVALVPVAWFAFALSYVRRVHRFRPPLVLALTAVPAVVIGLAWTNEFHHLIWADLRLSPTPGFVGLAVDHGPAFGVFVVYSYALVTAGTLILIYELSASRQHRRALMGVMLAPAFVSVPNVLHLTDSGPLFLDLTPLGFAIGAVVLVQSVLRTGLLELSPKLHREVLEGLTDGVVILDIDGHVLDVNAAARRILGLRGGVPATPAVAQLFGPERVRSADALEGCREVAVNGRSYDVRANRIDDGSPDLRKTVLVFRDVTERLRVETELRQVKQEMEHLAHTDPLTELPNRRYFMRRLHEETARLERSGQDLSVVLLDIDHFKSVNDTYGHDVGDEVLRSVARLIEGCSRGGDVAARLGGEEFALLLPGTPLEGARHAAERVRAAIQAHVFDGHAAGNFRVTVSAGVASARSAGDQGPLTLADQALYRAKDAGRNAVCG